MKPHFLPQGRELKRLKNLYELGMSITQEDIIRNLQLAYEGKKLDRPLILLREKMKYGNKTN